MLDLFRYRRPGPPQDRWRRGHTRSSKGKHFVFMAFFHLSTETFWFEKRRSIQRRQYRISASSFTHKVQIQYTTDILGVTAVFCSKIYMCFLIKAINYYGRMRTAIKVLSGLILSAFISGLFAVLSQCSLPEPWMAQNASQCPSAAGIHLFNGYINVTTDILLCILSIAMVWRLQSSDKNKYLIMALFNTRIL